MNNISNREIEELKKIKKYNKKTLKKLEKDYPVQYIIGYVDFYGLKIKVNKHNLIPRYETEYLIEKLLKYIKQYNFNSPKILDLCTGTGCIGLTLKHEIPSAKVTMTDISRYSIKLAKKNRKKMGLETEIYKSDLLKNIKENNYDIIISNPPYVKTTEKLPKNVTYEPKLALYGGNSGINHIRKILKEAKKYLNKKFIIALEINEQSEEELLPLVKKYYQNSNYRFEKDLAGKTRYLFIFNNCE